MDSCIFEGRVRHTRVQPVRHRFSYRIFLMYLDLDELPALFDRYWFWSARRPAPARFRREDHTGSRATALGDAVRDLVAERTGQRPDGPIRLLTHLRYFGYCFNPISLYYCFDRSGHRVETVVAEVNNTPWGERHCYVLPVPDGENRAMHFTSRKALHVSPFMGMDLDYGWYLTRPAATLRVFIASSEHGRRLFHVGMALRRREIGGRSLARVLVAYPLMTARVVIAIHWQALRLWWKGCPVFVHPDKRRATVSPR